MFGKTNYHQVITKFLANDFTFIKFNEIGNKKSIYLRHDIDFSIDSALEIASLENSIGVNSTFFFMLSSNFYNLLSDRNISSVREISSMGHDISLHFDPKVDKDFEERFKKEKKIFETTFNCKIDTVSIHRPGIFLEDNNRKLFDCRHTYEDYFFKEMNYLSDSGGKDILKKLNQIAERDENEDSDPLHLLIHPIWWSTESESPSHTLTSWLKSNEDFMIQETKKNCKTFKEI
tara:strand:+ start:568 stop:1266 length:699 start_codon:yes stop_codon:yes gene_type:complete